MLERELEIKNDQRFIKKFQQAKWRRLCPSLAENNKYYKLELSGAWEPLYRHRSLSLGEGKSS